MTTHQKMDRNSHMHLLQPCVVMALLLLLLTSCSFDNRLRLPPDVSPIAHATMATCTPNPTDAPRSCLMLVSPQKQQLWAVDMATGAVVPASNRFFPLTVPLGTSASRLAAVPRSPFVWALTAPQGNLLAVPIQGRQALASQPFAAAGTQQLATDVALFADSMQQTTALITAAKQKQIHVLPLETNTGVSTQHTRFVINLPTANNPQHIATDPNSQWAVITDAASNRVHVLPLQNLRKDTVAQAVDVGHTTRLVTIGQAQLAPQQPPQTVAMVVGDVVTNEKGTQGAAVAQTHITWIPLPPLHDPAQHMKLIVQNSSHSKDESQHTMSVQHNNKTDPDKGFVQVAYMPSGNDISPCCGQTTDNQEPWAAVATTRGTLMYIARNSQKQLYVAAQVQLSDRNQLGNSAANPVAFVGGALQLPQDKQPPNGMCKRQTFVVFPRLVASFCEGSSTFRRL